MRKSMQGFHWWKRNEIPDRRMPRTEGRWESKERWLEGWAERGASHNIYAKLTDEIQKGKIHEAYSAVIPFLLGRHRRQREKKEKGGNWKEQKKGWLLVNSTEKEVCKSDIL